MRHLAMIIMLCTSLSVFAQNNQRQKDLQPLPEPPPLEQESATPEPEITIIQRGEEKIEEYRINGRLYMMKVTPKYGPPFYLIDQRGDGQFSRQDHLDSGIRPPMWVIHQF